MEIEVRNILGLARANFTVEQGDIALVCGLNYSGKTSLLEAVGAALTANPKFRGITNKKDFGDLVRQGRKDGHVKVSNANGSVKLSLPSGDVESEGEPPAADAFSCHTRMIGALPVDQRQRLLTERLDAEPGKDDLVAWIKDAIKEGMGGVEEIPDQYFSAMMEKLWPVIDEEGWDGALKIIEGKGSKLRGAWEHITGEKYGTRKAIGWIHPNFDFDERKDYAAAVKDAEAALESAVGTQAVSDEHLASLRVKIKEGEEANARLADLQKASDDAAKARQKAAKALADAPKPPDSRGVWECPHCGEKIQEEREGQHIRRMVKANVEQLTDAELKERREAIIPLEGDDRRAAAALTEAEAELQKARDLINAGLDAETEYNAAKDEEGNDGAAVEKARGNLDEARTELQHYENMLSAARQAKAYALNQVLRHAVEPAGVRGKKLADKVEAFNLTLAKQSALFGCADVQIADDFEVNMGGRRYGLLSESEGLRADVITMVALAQTSNPAILLVDRLDLLDGGSRLGMLKVLRSTGLPSIVAMTTLKVENCPDLAGNDMGNVFWMDAGTLEETDR